LSATYFDFGIARIAHQAVAAAPHTLHSKHRTFSITRRSAQCIFGPLMVALDFHLYFALFSPLFALLYAYISPYCRLILFIPLRLFAPHFRLYLRVFSLYFRLSALICAFLALYFRLIVALFGRVGVYLRYIFAL
jgi:hypothetical protein